VRTSDDKFLNVDDQHNLIKEVPKESQLNPKGYFYFYQKVTEKAGPHEKLPTKNSVVSPTNNLTQFYYSRNKISFPSIKDNDPNFNSKFLHLS